jgi:transglutaminase/protease-like cytokinesis protein 3
MIKKVLILALILLFMGLPVDAQADAMITKEDVIRSIRDNFIAQKDEFTINMSKNTLMELVTNTDFLNAAALMDDPGTSKDGDYLKTNVMIWNARWFFNNEDKASLTISAAYRTTPDQEKLLDSEIKAAMTSLNIRNATEYDKVKAIHDYIIGMVSYDQSLTRYTAYSAFTDKSTVCLGYAAAAYRMFTDAGIDSRIISGVGGTEEHVWNIVKVDGKWYNIDLTWDDPILNNDEEIISYDFFLKNEKDFVDHKRAPEYNTKEFLDTYKLSEENYVIK